MSRAYKLVLVLCVGLLLAGEAHVQEVKHAPTIEQCRADQRLWLDKLERAVDTVPLPEDYRTLVGWTGEMIDCRSVDPENKLRYYNISGELASEKLIRFHHFLERHGLYDKFIEEDKAGKR
jgi:hypothetical protein